MPVCANCETILDPHDADKPYVLGQDGNYYCDQECELERFLEVQREKLEREQMDMTQDEYYRVQKILDQMDDIVNAV